MTIFQLDKNNRSQLIYANNIHSGEKVDFDGNMFRIKLSDPAMVEVDVLETPYPHRQDHTSETLTVTVHP